MSSEDIIATLESMATQIEKTKKPPCSTICAFRELDREYAQQLLQVNISALREASVILSVKRVDTKARLEQVLLEYIERVIKKETATVAEIEALPQIAAVLVRCINWGKD